MRYLALFLAMAFVSAEAKILVHGHRGARAARPENTLPAFEYALAQGVDALELDLAVTKDNVLVVSHDPEMNPKICRGPEGAERVIRKMTFAQLQLWDCGTLRNPEFPQQKPVPGTRVPKLAEVLQLAKGKGVDLNIETKIFPSRPELTPSPEEFARLVIEEVRRHGLEDKLILQSFDWRTLEAMKKLAPQVRLSALYPNVMNATRDYLGEALAAGYGFVSPHFRVTSKETVAKAHAAGVQVAPWTANEPQVWDVLIAAGVDAIITDDPAALIAYLKSKGLR
jgi:glycerophosphoryl diester phosphodiesterase